MIKYLVLIVLFFTTAFFTASNAEAFNKKIISAERSYLEGNYKNAVKECEKLFYSKGSCEIKSESAYLAGLSYLKLGDLKKARGFFEHTVDNSSNEILISEAELALSFIYEKNTVPEDPDFFCVQVGSFKSKRNAERLYRKFKRNKFTVRIVNEKNGKRSAYKIKIGKFKIKKEALKFAEKLKKWGHPTTIVAY